MKEGRARWLAELKAEGKPIPFGRKKGGRNRSPQEREKAAYEEQCMREWRASVHQGRSDRKAPRAQPRQERSDAAADERAWHDFKRVAHFGPMKNGRAFSRRATKNANVFQLQFGQRHISRPVRRRRRSQSERLRRRLSVSKSGAGKLQNPR
jgi:hypothetical protein